MPRDRTNRSGGRLVGAAAIALCLLAGLVAPGASSAAAPPEFFGVSAVRPTQEDFRLMPQYGVGAFRLGLGWRGIQPTPKQEYQWGGPDRQVRWASESGLQIFPYLIGTPVFVDKTGDDIVPPVRRKSHRLQWEAFVAAAVERYGPNGEFWQENPDLVERPVGDWVIWNEQNSRTFWHKEANPREYARLVRLARSGIDSADPNGRLIVGGMYGYPSADESMFAKRFLRKVYGKRGMVAAIDGISVHPYSPRIAGMKRQVKNLRDVAKKAGDGNVDLWIGEVGWASGGKRHDLVKSRAKQAKLLKRAYQLFLAKRQAWRIRSVMWFVWRDYEGDQICGWCAQAGLVESDHAGKPSGKTFRQVSGDDR